MSDDSTGDTGQLWSRKIQVIEEVDRGGMAYVLRGTDTKLRRELALKVAPAPRAELPQEQLARFIEEAQITAQLEHPNVVPVHEIGVDPDDRVYFSMKLVRGRSLESILHDREQGDADTLAEFGLRRLLDIFLQVCQAIEYAHARGVVHRDLKPANIMVGGFGEVLVMDWGIAKLAGRPDRDSKHVVTVSPGEPSYPEISDTSINDEVSSIRAGKKHLATQLGTVIGTPAYMAPEQARGADVDERADIYSLGVMLYEILCSRLPFEDEDPQALLSKVVQAEPFAPSMIEPRTPPALDAVAMRLLEKDPDKRLSIPEVRRHIRDYVEGVQRDYRRESLWTNALWFAGAVGLFAFLVWYVTGQSIAALFVLAPTTVFNSIGWFLLVVAWSYPLWSVWVALKHSRREPDLFRPGEGADVFVSGYLSHRTFAAAIAPLFQLVFIVQLVTVAVTHLTQGTDLPEQLWQRLMVDLRVEWSRALIVILVFLFGYLFFLYREVRYARRIDRYETLVRRSGWEATWPLFLIGILLVTIGLTDVLDWVVITGVRPLPYLRHLVVTQPIDLFEVTKTFVLQGTFLMGLVVAMVTVAFPFAEILAALRLPYQPTDQAAVRGRAQYFMRSVAVFRVARVNWLYGGAMMGCLTALAVLSGESSSPLLEQVLLVLGPSLIGFAGYWFTRRRLRRMLRDSPAVERMLVQQTEAARVECDRARIDQLSAAPIRWRLLVALVPIVCIGGFLAFTGSGLHQRALEQLVVPVSLEGWLLILPYGLLALVILGGDWIQLFLLRRSTPPDEGRESMPVPSSGRAATGAAHPARTDSVP